MASPGEMIEVVSRVFGGPGETVVLYVGLWPMLVCVAAVGGGGAQRG